MNRSPLVLSLFPGIGLLDSAFEAAGFAVVRGPDILWGGDIARFSVPPGRFEGVIGGPPCQVHSTASNIVGTKKTDLIPDFVRVVTEAAPRFVVMENVGGAGNPAIPAEWHTIAFRDWDAGGETARKRRFWTWPFAATPPPKRPGKPSHSVMATTHKRGRSGSQYCKDKGFLPGDLPIAEYARLQGVPHIGEALAKHGVSRAFACHLLGNGVPFAMGSHIARQAWNWWDSLNPES